MSTESSPKPAGRLHPLLLPNCTVFLASMAIMIAELVAGRLVSRHLGQSLYTWTSCIGVFLTGISIGNYLGGRLADRREARSALSMLFLLSAAACLAVAPINAVAGGAPWMWEQSLPLRIFIHITATFLLPAIALGTISPVAARMALAEGLATGRTIGQVYAWGAVGSIVGTYLTGFFLVAWFGSTETLYGVAALLALLGVIYKPRWVPAAAGGVSLALLGGWVLLGGTRADALAHALHVREPADPNLLFESESQYAYIAVRQRPGDPGHRSMVLDRLTHSQVDLNRPRELLYEYHRVFGAMTEIARGPDAPIKALVLGGGGFVFPRYLELTRPGSQIDVAEIDPEVTRGARMAFGLASDSQVQVFDVDGRMLVDRLIREKKGGYDFIYGDIVSDLLVPYHLVTQEFCTQLRELLAPDGIYLVIVIDSLEEGRLLTPLYATMRSVFPEVEVAACANSSGARDTFVLAGSRRAIPMSETLARLHEGVAFVGHAVARADLEARMERLGGKLLTDNHAPVENLLSGVGRKAQDEAIAKYTEEGIRFMAQGRTERGLAYLHRAVGLQPGHPLTCCNLARAQAEAGLVDEALQTLSAAVQSSPDEYEPHDLAAMLLARVGQVEAAAEQWRIVLRLRPDHLPALNNLGSALLMSSDPAGALTLFEQACQLDPRNVLSHYSRGVALNTLGRPAEARVSFEAALALRPDMAEARFGLGQARERMGDRAGAAEAYQVVLQQRPDFAAARSSLERLAAPAGP